jgi:Ni/Co efflux regulator RcnB
MKRIVAGIGLIALALALSACVSEDGRGERRDDRDWARERDMDHDNDRDRGRDQDWDHRRDEDRQHAPDHDHD